MQQTETSAVVLKASAVETHECRYHEVIPSEELTYTWAIYSPRRRLVGKWPSTESDREGEVVTAFNNSPLVIHFKFQARGLFSGTEPVKPKPVGSDPLLTEPLDRKVPCFGTRPFGPERRGLKTRCTDFGGHAFWKFEKSGRSSTALPQLLPPLSSSMPMVGGPLKKHGDVPDGTLCTPVRRTMRMKASPNAAIASSSIVTPPPPAMEIEDAPTTAKRKRTSIGGSTVKAFDNCFLSTNKKRARTSLSGPGTPGKATPMDLVRERDVAKRFIELEVTEAYKAIRKQTGALGGNAAGGAIYGEITQNSFQRVVDYLKENCELSKASRFLDVGSGLGKPNIHVAIDPGVEVSYGVELEELRWHLSLHNLKSVMKLDINKNKPHRTIFTAGDITAAKSFDPFSHVYSFDVGFPPDVMDHMARMFNRSSAQWLASFHAPRKVIDMYRFNVEHIGRVATSMAGSNEGHTCYFYRRKASPSAIENAKRRQTSEPPIVNATVATEGMSKVPVDPLFQPGFEILSRGKDGVLSYIINFFGEQHGGGRTRRQKRAVQTRRQLQERPLESYYRIVGKARVAESSGLKK
jgi:hypothetical protein